MTTQGEIAPIFVEDPKLPMTICRARKILGIEARDLSDEQLTEQIWLAEQLKEMFFSIIKTEDGRRAIMG